MPGLVQRCAAQPGDAAVCFPSPGSAPAHGVWSKQRDDVGLDQLQKFWNELTPQARHELLRIDKHSLFEQARKNLYCSRCNGLLLEGFSQIVMYGKSLQLEGGGVCAPTDVGGGVEGECNEAINPSVHPWGGLMASRDGMLSLIDCYLYGKSLWVLQSVFDSARARERERELLYPDACGGGGRGWISHGTANYGRIARETCALHTARLSCDTLVDFWSALGDETRLSLFRMKEEDFIERLMYRFDSKRFCRDCRKNVIREFKELKELKRMRREPRCTAWFCAADTAFQYEVSKNKVQAEWHQCFIDAAGAYHHFEWAIGSGEGKTDILAFEDVGKTRDAHADELELDALDACYITLRACRLDGRCSELTVKAHALKGKPCVHRRLIVGDGFVTITKGESIRTFFDHAEEAEEEEDDDTIDKDGNELDGDGSRPQKHAKSPELAREFLLDAATVIFKGQVEKAFREGTARQNAHSLFVCLALKLLEERLHVACKEIITLEKQVKLLEEEEKEKREEEERRERRRAKEREKKLRRKERLRGKERERERKDVESDPLSPSGILEVVPAIPQDEVPGILDEGGPGCEVGEPMIATSTSPETPTNQILHGFANTRTPKSNTHIMNVEFHDREINGSFTLEQSRSSRRRLRFHHDPFQERIFEWSAKCRSVEDGDNNVRAGISESKSNGCNDASSRCTNSGYRFSRENVVKTSARNPTSRFNEKLIVHGAKNRTRGRNDYHSCNCNQPSGYRGKDIQFAPIIRSSLGVKAINTMDTPFRTSHHNDRQSHRICTIDASAVSKEKQVSSRSNTSRDLYRKQVWEPTDSRKKNQGDEVETTISGMAIDSLNHNEKDVQNECEDSCNLRTPDESCLSVESVEPVNANDCTGETNSIKAEGILSCCSDAFDLVTETCFSKADEDDVGSFSASPTSTLDNGCDSMASSSSSDNGSSCISEADCSTSFSCARNAESSSTSDSEDVNQQFDGREMPVCSNNEFCTFQDTKKIDKANSFSGSAAADLKFDSFSASKISRDNPLAELHKDNNTHVGYEVPQRQQQMLPTPNNGIHSAYLPTMGYHNQNPTSWAAATNSGILSFSQPRHYLFPSSFGYSIPACRPPDFYLRYSGLQPLTNSVIQVSQAPLFQNVSKMNTLNFNRKTENITGAGSHVNVTVNKPSSMPAPDGSPHEKQSRKESHNTGNHDELHDDISSFSLFHFNGPVAVASGNGVDSTQSKHKTVLEAGLNQNFPEKETVVEEYSLFASRSGSRFSFF